jgi:hypothetical protein
MFLDQYSQIFIKLYQGWLPPLTQDETAGYFLDSGTALRASQNDVLIPHSLSQRGEDPV